MKDLTVFFTPHPPIIIPEIGGGKESEAKDTIEGMHKLGKLAAEIKPETIIYITPHGNTFRNGTAILDEQKLEGDFGSFGFSNIIFKKELDTDLTHAIFNKFEEEDIISVLLNKSIAKKYGVKVGLDHGAMVPMYFIDLYYKEYKIVHITPGFTPLEENYKIGQLIQDVINQSGKSVLTVCSGDLSHALKDDGPYAYHPSGAAFDDKIEAAISNSDPVSLIEMDSKFIDEAAQCGLRSFLIGFGLVDSYGYQSDVLSHEGPFGVGYLTGYLKMHKDDVKPSLLQELDKHLISAYEAKKVKEDDYIKLARMSIEEYVRERRKLDFDDVKDSFSEDFIKEAANMQAGTFVSIHSDDSLRGCIGTTGPTQKSLLEEIIYNSINACSQDPRFNPVEAKELMGLDINVDVLGETEPISSKEELDVIKYGVIVEKGMKRGLLLPNLDGVDTIDEQVSIAMRKAGINNDENMKLYRFEVQRHEIKP